MNSTSDEIDLLKILTKILQGIKSNFILLVVTFVIGLGLGLVNYQFNPKIYQSEVVITSDILTESHYNSIFPSLQKLIKEGNVITLSDDLHLSETQASAIRSIELKLVTEESDRIEDKNKTYIKSKTYAHIVVKSSDNTIWPNLQTGISNFIENNDFVKIRVEQKRKYYASLITVIDHELKDLEIIKSKIMDGKTTSNIKDEMLLWDPAKIIDLNEEKLNCQNSLELINSVQILESFTEFEKPISPKLSISLAVGSSLGILCTIIFIGFKSLVKLVTFADEGTD